MLKANELNYRKTGLYRGISPATVTNYSIYQIDTSKITYKTGTLHVYSEEFSEYFTSNYGSVDTYGVLLDSQGCELARNSDSGEDDHFRLSHDYDPGETYYIKIGLERTPQNSALFKLHAYVSSDTDYEQIGLIHVDGGESIDKPGEENLYRIDVPKPGILHVITGGFMDTYGSLYKGDKYGRFHESEDSLICENDDVIDLMYDSSNTVLNHFNCYLKRYVEPGTYYVKIRLYSPKETGSYIISTIFEELDLGASSVISANGLHADSFDKAGAYSNYKAYRIDIQQTGTLSVKLSGDTETRRHLLDSAGNVLESNDDIEPESGRRIAQEVHQGRYYLVMHHSMLDGTGGYGVATSFASPVNYTVVPYDLSLDPDTSHLASIDNAGDYSIYRMTVTNQGTLTVYTTGSMDTFGQLLDHSGKELESSDDAIVGFSNFYISRNVDPGTYYVKVRHYSDSGTGDYEIVRSSVNSLEDIHSDLDGDGLSRYEETHLFSYYHLDPLNPDSDGNGTSDGYEDFDNDRVSNKFEINRYDSHPLDAYSLDPNGEITDASWLFLAPMDINSVSSLMNAWDQIQAIDDRSTSLILVSSGQEESLVSSSSRQATTRFVGTTTSNGESHLNFTLDSDQTNAVHDLYYLASLSIGFYWERVGEVRYGATNSIPASLFPSNQGFFTSGSKEDADEDGLTDGFELLVTRTSPTNPDSAVDLDNDGVPESFLDYSDNLIRDSEEDFDADGLPNLLEYRVRTNPLSSDSDRDGISDSEEDSNGDGTTDLEEHLNTIELPNGYRDFTVLLNVEGTEDIYDLEYCDIFVYNDAVSVTSAVVTNQTFLQIRYQFLKDNVFFKTPKTIGSRWTLSYFANGSSLNDVSPYVVSSNVWGQADLSHVVMPTINQAKMQEDFDFPEYQEDLNFETINIAQERIQSIKYTHNIIKLFDYGIIDSKSNYVPAVLQKSTYLERLHSYRTRALHRHRFHNRYISDSHSLGYINSHIHYDNCDIFNLYDVSELTKTFNQYANDIVAEVDPILSGSLPDLMLAIRDAFKGYEHAYPEVNFNSSINNRSMTLLAGFDISSYSTPFVSPVYALWIDPDANIYSNIRDYGSAALAFRVLEMETRTYMVWDPDTRFYYYMESDPDGGLVYIDLNQ